MATINLNHQILLEPYTDLPHKAFFWHKLLDMLVPFNSPANALD